MEKLNKNIIKRTGMELFITIKLF